MRLAQALEFASHTHPGMVRAHNEDSLGVAPELGLAILADGMGGYNAGEVASGIAVSLLQAELRQLLEKTDPSEPHPKTGEMAGVSMLREHILRANTSVYQAAQSQPQYAGMGTTLVVTLFCDNRLIVAHIGDSRLYRLRGDMLEQITRDHSLLQEQLDSGMITREEARVSEHKNLVTRAQVAGYLEPIPEAEAEGRVFEFVNAVRGGNIPAEFMGAVEKGFRDCITKGRLIGFPVTGVRVVVEDGQAHSVDSSDIAFQQAARGAFRAAYPGAKPIVLEPVMKLAVEGPADFQGAVLKTIMQRRGTVIGTTEQEGFCQVESEVPLSEMFGYATDLRSATQGKAEFTLEFARYSPAPAELTEQLVDKYKTRIKDED